MFNKSYTNIILASSLLLCLITLPVSQADLMCYVCDDCATMPKDAPLLACNEDFFNPGGSTEASTVTTTTPASTTDAVESTTPMETSPTTIASTIEESSTDPASTTTEEVTSTSEQSAESTEAPIPTPNTAGPVETTTGVPTPPQEDLNAVPASAANTTRLVQIGEESSSNATPLAIRQRRALINTDYSYHCYTVQKSINGSTVTDRGCSRVSTYQSVCGLLMEQNNNTQLSNCDPCSMNACNGSSLLQNSMLVTVLLAAIAALVQAN
ncbi:uncharacterized protein [Drosophila tropicalis]|uniref:uncharacterized protein n=1 Tax=Drosophila tropicalis TaxID=46794 RepID=UPI0035AB7E96